MILTIISHALFFVAAVFPFGFITLKCDMFQVIVRHSLLAVTVSRSLLSTVRFSGLNL